MGGSFEDQDVATRLFPLRGYLEAPILPTAATGGPY